MLVEISEKSLVIAAEAAGSKLHHYERMSGDNRLGASIEAHARTLDAFEAFKREVSDAVEEIAKVWGTADPAWGYLRRFILPKPVDPLVEAMLECGFGDSSNAADDIRAALAARGLEIREIEQ